MFGGVFLTYFRKEKSMYVLRYTRAGEPPMYFAPAGKTTVWPANLAAAHRFATMNELVYAIAATPALQGSAPGRYEIVQVTQKMTLTDVEKVVAV